MYLYFKPCFSNVIVDTTQARQKQESLNHNKLTFKLIEEKTRNTQIKYQVFLEIQKRNVHIYELFFVVHILHGNLDMLHSASAETS